MVGIGVSGELSAAGGVAGGLTAFVLTPDLFAQLCCGAVAGSVNFYTLGSNACTFIKHQKKVDVVVNHIYLSTGHNSVLTHHHMPASLVDHEHLVELLTEQHSQSE